MSIDNIQRQRYEYKYRITENVANGIRDFVSSYLEIDSFGATQPDLSYPVHSLYMDSPGMRTFQETINGNKNRYKLRIRFYEQMEDCPVYFEIKRRFDNVIDKKRAMVHRYAALDVVKGFLPGHASLVEPSAEQLDALFDFTRLVNNLQAEVKVHVRYDREAWVSEGENKIRVTLDRNIHSESKKFVSFSPEMSDSNPVFGNNLILELKFTNRFPNWFHELVQVFGLRQVGAGKYVDGVTKIGENRFLPSHV